MKNWWAWLNWRVRWVCDCGHQKCCMRWRIADNRQVLFLVYWWYWWILISKLTQYTGYWSKVMVIIQTSRLWQHSWDVNYPETLVRFLLGLRTINKTCEVVPACELFGPIGGWLGGWEQPPQNQWKRWNLEIIQPTFAMKSCKKMLWSTMIYYDLLVLVQSEVVRYSTLPSCTISGWCLLTSATQQETFAKYVSDLAIITFYIPPNWLPKLTSK